MTIPCTQETNITNIHHVLERMEDAQAEDRRERREFERQIMSILEKVADQGARINHLEDHSEILAEDVKLNGDKTHALELTITQLTNFYSIVWSKPAKYVYTSFFIAMNLLIIFDVVTHWSLFREIVTGWFQLTNGKVE